MNKKYINFFNETNTEKKLEIGMQIFNKINDPFELAYFRSEFFNSFHEFIDHEKNKTIDVDILLRFHIFFTETYDDLLIQDLIAADNIFFKHFKSLDKKTKRIAINIFAYLQVRLNSFNYFVTMVEKKWFDNFTLTKQMMKDIEFIRNFKLLDARLKNDLISSSINTNNKPLLELFFPNKHVEISKTLDKVGFAWSESNLKILNNISNEGGNEWLGIHVFDTNTSTLISKFTGNSEIELSFNYIFEKFEWLIKHIKDNDNGRFMLESILFMFDSLSEQIIFTFMKTILGSSVPENKIDPSKLFQNNEIKEHLMNEKFNKQYVGLCSTFLYQSFSIFRSFDFGQKYKDGELRNILYHRVYNTKEIDEKIILDVVKDKILKTASILKTLWRIIIVFEERELDKMEGGNWVRKTKDNKRG